mmetsp:Transcript_33107/g.80446  ORF Transcript_33107/g.80446 Transcript_33107/m.80446 type:complete len:217 (+) Transcript_33107:460-1110(+)
MQLALYLVCRFLIACLEIERSVQAYYRETGVVAGFASGEPLQCFCFLPANDIEDIVDLNDVLLFLFAMDRQAVSIISVKIIVIEAGHAAHALDVLAHGIDGFAFIVRQTLQLIFRLQPVEALVFVINAQESCMGASCAPVFLHLDDANFAVLDRAVRVNSDGPDSAIAGSQGHLIPLPPLTRLLLGRFFPIHCRPSAHAHSSAPPEASGDKSRRWG